MESNPRTQDQALRTPLREWDGDVRNGLSRTATADEEWKKVAKEEECGKENG